VRIKTAAAGGVFAVSSVACQPYPNETGGQIRGSDALVDAPCEHPVCKLHDWSVRYIPMDPRSQDIDGDDFDGRNLNSEMNVDNSNEPLHDTVLLQDFEERPDLISVDLPGYRRLFVGRNEVIWLE
jgi:hypothetical protein